MSSQRKTLITPEEYLAAERTSEVKHEYFAGEIFAMVGASRRHNLIAANIIRVLGNQLLDRTQPGEFNQALIELGATLCLPKQTQCLLCPVAARCEARRLGRQHDFPIKRKRASPTVIEKELLIVGNESRILFWQRAASPMAQKTTSPATWRKRSRPAGKASCSFTGRVRSGIEREGST